MGERLLHTFGILYRLYLCLFISFKFIRMLIEDRSRLGRLMSKVGEAPVLLGLRSCRDSEHKNKSDPFRR